MPDWLRGLLRALVIMIALGLGLVGLLLSICGGMFVGSGMLRWGLMALAACAGLMYLASRSRTPPPEPPDPERYGGREDRH